MKEQENYDFESDLDAFLDYICQLPKPAVKLLNFKRYHDLLEAFYKLQKLLKETNPESKLSIDIDQNFNFGCISVELTDLSVIKPLDFSAVIKRSDNFEIYPLVNGNLKFDITFHNVIKGYYGEVLS